MLRKSLEIMRSQPLYITLLLGTMMVAVGGSNVVARTHRFAQDKSVVTERENVQVQAFAKRFVARLLTTRDVAPLIPHFFLPDFTSFAKQDFYEKVSPSLYSSLPKEERVRLFVAQENLGYIITLDVMTNPDPGDTSAPPFKRILPNNVAQSLNRSRLVEGTTVFTNREELLKEVTELEKSILEARAFLKKRNPEQLPFFLRKIRKFERDPYLGYRVRASLIDEDATLESGLVRFAGQKAFIVDTPILIGLVVLNDGGRLRVLTMIPADGD